MNEKTEVAVVQVRNDNNEMAQAILEARRTLGEFLECFHAPRPNQAGFHLKVRFEVDGNAEHIWLSELDLESSPATGVVANDGRIPGFEFGRRVPFERASITDWVFTEDGEMRGGHTTRVLIKLRLRQASTGVFHKLRRRLLQKETVH